MAAPAAPAVGVVSPMTHHRALPAAPPQQRSPNAADLGYATAEERGTHTDTWAHRLLSLKAHLKYLIVIFS